jgi:hypothetical protein
MMALAAAAGLHLASRLRFHKLRHTLSEKHQKHDR